MTRNLKALGLALVAALALSALGAAAAQATQVNFTAAKYPADLHGQSANHLFTFNSRQVTCENATLTGILWEASSKLEIGPTYSNCHTKPVLGVKFPATVTKGGCFYTFTVVTSTTEGTVDIECPAGGGMQFHLYQPGKPHTPTYEVCTFTILSQENLGEVDFNQVGTQLEATMTLGSVAYTEEKGEGICAPKSGNGSFIGSTLFTAEFENGEKTEKIKVDIG